MNNRSAARLQGFVLRRLKSSSKSWVKVSPEHFQAVTGLSRRQFFYAKRALEIWKGRVVQFRTVLKQSGRGWEIVATSISLPNALEVFCLTSGGKDRRARPNLRLSFVTECNAIRGFSKEKQVTKPTRVVLEPSASMIRLAHHLKRVIEGLHWDNCKVIYSPGHAFNYARDMLVRGISYELILDGYEQGLSAMHASATDYGLLIGNPRLRFVASSTVSRARSAVWASLH